MHVELVVPPTSQKPRSKMFPILVFLLMACYGLMALVLVEQGNVIRSQRSLIMQLFQESQQLSSLRGQEAAQHAIEKKQGKAMPSVKGKECHSCPLPMDKNQAKKLLGQKNRVEKEKQPMQAVDKVDRRRFPAQI